MLKVNVKWNRELYDGLSLDTTASVEQFKYQLFSITGVEPDRIRLLTKGKFLKDDTNLQSLNIQENQLITMMGTPGEKAYKPAEKEVVFLEDMTDAQLNEALDLPVGLTNLGNTCYMNSVLQVLKSIPELSTHLQENQPTLPIVSALKDVLTQLDKSSFYSNGYQPFTFLQQLRTAFPKFSQTDGPGMYSQQDAEECWTSIVSQIQQNPLKDSKSFIDSHLTGLYRTTLTNTELESESSTNMEQFTKLDCHITREVNHMSSGLEAAFKDSIDKFSNQLNKQTKFEKTFLIERLPQYLPINFVRFFWKPVEKVKAKILKKVKFPLILDMYPYCTPELQKKLDLARNEVARQVEAEKQRKANLDSTEPTLDSKQLQQLVEDSAHPDLKSDLGSNTTGHFQLKAVLTHAGRTADSGHYIGWVKDPSKENQWFKFDDDKVSIVDDAAILNLDGGGDWHTAYLCLYGPKV